MSDKSHLAKIKKIKIPQDLKDRISKSLNLPSQKKDK
jgi:hypothetical protein